MIGTDDIIECPTCGNKRRRVFCHYCDKPFIDPLPTQWFSFQAIDAVNKALTGCQGQNVCGAVWDQAVVLGRGGLAPLPGDPTILESRHQVTPKVLLVVRVYLPEQWSCVRAAFEFEPPQEWNQILMSAILSLFAGENRRILGRRYCWTDAIGRL